MKGKGVDTNFEQPSILGKPPLQTIRNQPVVRQPTAYKFERSQFPKHRFASQVDVSNDLTKPVTPHSWLQVRQSAIAKPYHVNAFGPSRNSSKTVSKTSPRESIGSNDMVHNYYLEEAKKKLCSMVRDMSLNVRINAFNALGNIGVVSDCILLQTLSKRIDKEFPCRLSVKHFNLPISTGAFVHGLKDEFCEVPILTVNDHSLFYLKVRNSTCYSIRIHVIRSATCAAGALDLLMDVLNDDSAIVRLQALRTMHHMDVLGHLKVQEMHMHMVRVCAEELEPKMKMHNTLFIKSAKTKRINRVALSINEPQESFPNDSSNSNKFIVKKKNVVVKADHCIGLEVEKLVATLLDDGIILLENVKFYKEEENNDPPFAEKELDYLDGAVSNPKRPFVAIVVATEAKSIGSAGRSGASQGLSSNSYRKNATVGRFRSSRGYVGSKSIGFAGRSGDKPRPSTSVLCIVPFNPKRLPYKDLGFPCKGTFEILPIVVDEDLYAAVVRKRKNLTENAFMHTVRNRAGENSFLTYPADNMSIDGAQ
ncbi:protein SIEL [Tanacetum coccineum]